MHKAFIFLHGDFFFSFRKPKIAKFNLYYGNKIISCILLRSRGLLRALRTFGKIYKYLTTFYSLSSLKWLKTWVNYWLFLLQFEELFEPYTQYCLEQTNCQLYCKEHGRENNYFKAYLAVSLEMSSTIILQNKFKGYSIWLLAKPCLKFHMLLLVFLNFFEWEKPIFVVNLV